MKNSKFKKIFVLAGILLLQPLLNPGSLAHARKRSPPKAYSFIAEGGKASQGECDGERKIPRKMRRLPEHSKARSYMGSELQDPEIKGKPGEEMWKHLFRDKSACNAVLAKTPSSVQSEATKGPKQELPPDDSVDSEEEAEQADQADSSEAAD